MPAEFEFRLISPRALIQYKDAILSAWEIPLLDKRLRPQYDKFMYAVVRRQAIT